MTRITRILSLALLIGAWATTSVGEGRVGSNRPIRIYHGTLSLVFADGVEAGRLDQADGKCVGVSLPKGVVGRLRKLGPKTVSIRGSLFEVPNDIELSSIHVNGRQVGFRQCNNAYIFVFRNSDVHWLKTDHSRSLGQ